MPSEKIPRELHALRESCRAAFELLRALEEHKTYNTPNSLKVLNEAAKDVQEQEGVRSYLERYKGLGQSIPHGVGPLLLAHLASLAKEASLVAHGNKDPVGDRRSELRRLDQIAIAHRDQAPRLPDWPIITAIAEGRKQPTIHELKNAFALPRKEVERVLRVQRIIPVRKQKGSSASFYDKTVVQPLIKITLKRLEDWHPKNPDEWAIREGEINNCRLPKTKAEWEESRDSLFFNQEVVSPPKHKGGRPPKKRQR